MNLIPYQIVRFAAFSILVISVIVSIFLTVRMRRKSNKWKTLRLIEIEGIVLLVTLAVGLFAGIAYSGFLSIPQFVKTVGPGEGPHLPILSSFKFFSKISDFKKVQDITADPNEVIGKGFRRQDEVVQVDILAREVIAEIYPGITYNYWTFDEQVPGPFLRVKTGDLVNVTLTNHESNLHVHSIDFHAVNGPGGGANVLYAKPGEKKSFYFKAINPGLYIYHCASPPSAAAHMAHGQYGLILVEPGEGLPKVDKEFYVVQGEIYTMGEIGDRGLQAFDAKAMLEGNANYVVFNGKVKSLNGRLKAKVGDKVRIYIGNGGVNYISSFHVIGEIFDTVYPEGSINGALFHNVQSTIVPAGGSSIVEFTLEEPGNYVLVDHALARVEKGAYGILEVSGDFNKEIYYPMPQIANGEH